MAKVLHCDPANNAELKKLRATYNLGRQLIATIAGVSKSLVDNWLVREDSPHFRPMPGKSLRLIQLELGLEKPSYVALRREAEKRAAAIKGEPA